MEKRVIDTRREIPSTVKTIGVLGGLGPQATMDFEQHIHAASQQLLKPFENRTYPPMLTYYLRHQPMRLNDDGSMPVVLEPHPHLLEIAKMLGANTNFLVVPSNTPHVFLKDIEKAAGKKVLNMIDLAIDDVKRRSPQKVGVLAIGHTFRSGLYQHPLDVLGIQWEGIDEDIALMLDEAIFAVMQGTATEEHRQVAENAVGNLRQKQAGVIILGCSELPLLLGKETEAPDLINPIQLLAEAAVQYAIAS